LGSNESFGPRFTTGDVIGCGYNNITKEIFFTKNGCLVGVAFENVSLPSTGMFATVGLAGPGERVALNFGQTPFAFSFDFTQTNVFTPAPKAEPGQEHHPEPPSRFQTGELGEAFDTFAMEWHFLGLGEDKHTTATIPSPSSSVGSHRTDSLSEKHDSPSTPR
jgi:hypothetical protein